MPEEKTPLSPTPEANQGEKAENTGRRKLTHGQQQRRQKSVFQYITILFGAAFLLLLFTFVMERHQNELLQQQNQAQIDDLQQSSVSAVQSLNNLVKENDTLKEQVAQLEEQLADYQDQVDVLPDVISNLEHTLDCTQQALDWFWQIDEAYVRGKYALCRSLIVELETAPEGGTPLKEYLPKESATHNGRFSPADRYQEICDKVF